MVKKIRTRFAPSPTGFLHIGSLRTALYSYALAKGQNGTFVLRIEDTDRKRYVEASVEGIINILHIFGIESDEGPRKGGKYKPYIQSERLDIYKQKAEELVDKGYAYYCFLSEEELTRLKVDKKTAFRSPHRDLSSIEVKKRLKDGQKYVIRLKMPINRKIEIYDEILGNVSWNSDDVDDTVLLKASGFPTYHLGVVVDDVLMKITHITRGIEWLPSVPKHVIIYEGMDYTFPKVAHMPLILDPSGGKLSKRKGAVSADDFLKEGYLPEAILNFIMLLGWSPPLNRKSGEREKEIFTLDEFVELYDMKDMNKASPVFDRKKLKWFNGQYIRKVGLTDLLSRFKSWCKSYHGKSRLSEKMLNDKTLSDKVSLVKERVSTLSDIYETIDFFYEELPLQKVSEVKGLKDKASAELSKVAEDLKEVFQNALKGNNYSQEEWVAEMRKISDKYNWKPADVFMLLRLLICRSQFSPPLYESLMIIGKDEVIIRLLAYINDK